MQATHRNPWMNRIRRRLKRVFDHTPNETLKLNFLRAVPFWIASLITGLIAVFYSRLFLLAESNADALFRSYSLVVVYCYTFLFSDCLVAGGEV